MLYVYIHLTKSIYVIWYNMVYVLSWSACMALVPYHREYVPLVIDLRKFV